MYKNLLETNSSSVMKQLDIIGKHLPNNHTGLVVHTLKSGGNPKSSKHRYISNMTILSMITSGHQNMQDDCRSSQFTLPTQLLLSFRYLYLTNNTPKNNEVWNDALHNYIVQGQLPPVTLMYYNRYLQWIAIIYMTSCHCSAVFPTFTGGSA